MSARPGIQAVIWDLGGVIVRTEDRRGRSLWEAKLGLAERELDRIVFAGVMGRKAALGQADAAEVWSWVGEQLHLDDRGLTELRRAFWRGDHVDHQLMDFIRHLRPACQTGLLSNAWPELRRDIEVRWRIADAFDQIVISAEVGLAKPDTRIYRLILGRLNVQPAAAVFVDDFEENIAAAASLGMRAVPFNDPRQAMDDVRKLLSQ